jgi:hypothetical protein
MTGIGGYAWMFVASVAPIVTAIAVWRAADALREIARGLQEVASATRAGRTTQG